jgi:hypothetical protein
VQVSTFAYLAGLIAQCGSAIAYLVTRKATFRATMDAADNSVSLGSTGGRASAGYHPNHPLVFVIECIAGTGFLWAGFHNQNLWFFAPAVALLVSPLVAVAGWQNRIVRWLATIPLFIIGLLLVLIGIELCRRD